MVQSDRKSEPHVSGQAVPGTLEGAGKLVKTGEKDFREKTADVALSGFHSSYLPRFAVASFRKVGFAFGSRPIANTVCGLRTQTSV